MSDLNHDAASPSVLRNLVEGDASALSEETSGISDCSWQATRKGLSGNDKSTLNSNTESTDTQNDSIPFPKSSQNRWMALLTHVSTWWTLLTNPQHPFPKLFEAPNIPLLIAHGLFCVITFPILLLTASVATSRTLFWARFLVGAGCNIMALFIGLTLGSLAQPLLEACVWATLIQASYPKNVSDSDTGVSLRDFETQANDPRSAYGALKLLWRRWTTRKHRLHSSRFWAGYNVLFLVSVFFCATLSFFLGRVVDIVVQSQRQSLNVEFVSIFGDVSTNDVHIARNHGLVTRLLKPYTLFQMPSYPSSFSLPGSESVHYYGITDSQLLYFPRNILRDEIPLSIEPGVVLRFPRWATQTRCSSIPDLPTHLFVSESGTTYLFTPRATVASLLESFDRPIYPIIEKPFTITPILLGNDMTPPRLNLSSVVSGARYADNGIPASIKSTVISRGEDGTGFVTMESVLIRINSSYAPHGQFRYKHFERSEEGLRGSTFIGFDAAVCIQVCEPWMFSVYNSSRGSPVVLEATRDDSFLRFTTGQKERFGFSLNSSRARSIFFDAHEQSVNLQMDNFKERNKDFGLEAYALSLPLKHLAHGSDKFGYTMLSPHLFAEDRSRFDAMNVLPNLSGSGMLLARAYKDKLMVVASLNTRYFILTLGIIFFVGLLCAMCVPRLPLEVRRRGLGLSSWILAFHTREVEVEGYNDISHGMELDELQKLSSEIILRHRKQALP